MTLDRRAFVTLGAATLMTSLTARAIDREDSPWGRIRAVAFDAFPIFDPRPVFKACEEAGQGRDLFVAFAGWDVAGARWFGYPTFWNNRQGAPAEGLAAEPDGAGATLNDVVQFLAAR